MKDTSEHVERVYRDMLMRRSGAERLQMGSEMFDMAQALARASLGDATGKDNSAEMRVALFLRIYGHDFDEGTRMRIVAHLRRTSPSPNRTPLLQT